MKKKWPKLGLHNFGLCFSSHSWLSSGYKNLHVRGQVFHLLRSMVGCPLTPANSESCHRFPQLIMVQKQFCSLRLQEMGNTLVKASPSQKINKIVEKQTRKDEVSWEIVTIYLFILEQRCRHLKLIVVGPYQL